MVEFSPFDEATICQLIEILYASTLADGDKEGAERLLREIYIKAKKMNRKLVLYKYGELVPKADESFKEEDWHDILDRIRDKYRLVGLK